MAQPINNWAEFRKVLRQLKDQKAKDTFYTITIDTVDIAYDYCTKYICDNAQRSDGGYGVDSISDIPFACWFNSSLQVKKLIYLCEYQHK